MERTKWLGGECKPGDERPVAKGRVWGADLMCRNKKREAVGEQLCEERRDDLVAAPRSRGAGMAFHLSLTTRAACSLWPFEDFGEYQNVLVW